MVSNCTLFRPVIVSTYVTVGATIIVWVAISAPIYFVNGYALWIVVTCSAWISVAFQKTACVLGFPFSSTLPQRCVLSCRIFVYTTKVYRLILLDSSDTTFSRQDYFHFYFTF